MTTEPDNWRWGYWRDRAVRAEAQASELRRELERAERRIQALTDSLTYANDERGELKRELSGLQAYIHKQTEAWGRHV